MPDGIEGKGITAGCACLTKKWPDFTPFGLDPKLEPWGFDPAEVRRKARRLDDASFVQSHLLPLIFPTQPSRHLMQNVETQHLQPQVHTPLPADAPDQRET